VLARVQYEKDTGEAVFAAGAQPGGEKTITVQGTLRGPGQAESIPAELMITLTPGAMPRGAASSLRGLCEQMERSRYVGPSPQAVVRALAMVTLAACRTSLTDDERIVVEDWASPRGLDGPHFCRSLDWPNANRGFDWLYKTFTPRWRVDERVRAALEEQLRWLTALDPTAPKPGPVDVSGERAREQLDGWLRAPMGQDSPFGAAGGRAMRMLALFTAEAPWPDPDSLEGLEQDLRKSRPDAARVVSAYRELCAMSGSMAGRYVSAIRQAKKRKGTTS